MTRPTSHRCFTRTSTPLFLLTLILSLALPQAAVSLDTRTERPRVGLVLGGGGARGGAHVGVIKMLDRLRIPVDVIAGTSMGAIVGGLYASGLSADELSAVFENADWSVLLSDRPPRGKRSFRRKSDDVGFLVNFDLGLDHSGLVFPGGFIQGQNLEMALKRFALPVITVDDFDQLPIPFGAVATDLVSGDPVILRSGDLATAMRASMSAPGVFKPVKLNGRTLVDGGVVNNLPVQIARDMGAEVLIVVDAGFPLKSEAELGSAISIADQMLTILINARATEQAALLTASDVLISPDLGALGSQEFHRTMEASVLGWKKAAELAAQLARFSLAPEAYAAHRKEIGSRVPNAAPIDRLVVENESNLAAEVIAERLSDQTGGLLDLEQLESDISNIYGFDTFESVTYDIEQDGEETTLAVRGTEKSWGPNYIRFGINLEDDFKGNSSYNVAARFTKTEINKRGGEVRAELQIGESPRLFTEWYQPLDYASRWFVNPQLELGRFNTGLFDEGRQLARLRSDQATLSLDGGRQFGNWGEFRLGYQRSRSNDKLQIGLPAPTGGSLDLGGVFANLGHDTIDRVAVPRSGTLFNVTVSTFRESLGSDASFDLGRLFLLKPQTWGKNTLLHWWDFGSTLDAEAPGLEPFSLGGFFSLSGYAPDELSGRHFGIGRLIYYRRLGDQVLPVLDSQIYAGASFEAGNVWDRRSDISFGDSLKAGSVFFVFDTLVGPLYLAYGRGQGGRESAYLFLGQTF